MPDAEADAAGERALQIHGDGHNSGVTCRALGVTWLWCDLGCHARLTHWIG